MKYNKDIVQGLASYIDLQDVKNFIEGKNRLLQEKSKVFNVGLFVTGVIIAPLSSIEYIKI